MSKFDVAADLYFVKEKGETYIHFCGDSFYGEYTTEEFGEFICELFQRYLELCSIQLKQILNVNPKKEYNFDDDDGKDH